MNTLSVKKLVILATIAVTAGCTKFDFQAPKDDQDTNLKPSSEYFDFKTSQVVNLDVNYGSLGANTLIDIYDEFPETMNADGDPSTNGTPLCRVFTNENGQVREDITLPAHAKQVYLYANGFGIPTILKSTIENGHITIDATQTAQTRAAQPAMTRAANAEKQYKVWTVDETNNLYCINPWEGNRYGKVTDVNGIISEGDITGDHLRRLQAAFWNGLAYRKTGNDNRKWAQDVDERALATTLAKKGMENGKEVTYTDAEVWVTLATEYAYSQISLGYYYYPSDQKQTPESFNKLKKYIIFPNVSVGNSIPYCENGSKVGGVLNYGAENAPVSPNTRCQLLYVDDEGHVSTHFPAGYTIGYFIVSKLVTNSKNMLPDATYKIPSILGDTRRCAEGYMNKDGHYSCVTLLADNTTTYFCFENKTPKEGDPDSFTFDDVIFGVTTSPNGIDKQYKPKDLPEKTALYKADQTTYRTYTYEDLWPTAGDYDLNDVMVEHQQTIYFFSNGRTSKIVDTFIPCQPVGAADYRNAFAFYADYMKGSVVECSDGIVKEDETGAYIICPNTNDAIGKPFTITSSPIDVIMKENVAGMNTDPFIIVNYQPGKNNRTEVHLPKHTSTVLANKSLTGTKADAYFVDKDGNHPFALEIPLPSIADPKHSKIFVPATEGRKIDEEFPNFKSWATSDGQNSQDWYMHRK